jgi:hypothetical protein
MSVDRVQLGETFRISVVALDAARAGVTAATVTLLIRRDSDGYYWNGTTFQSAATTVTMTETNATNLPGYYHHDFKPPTTDCGYTYRATSASATITNKPFDGQLRVGFWVDEIDSAVGITSATALAEILAKLGNTNIADEFRRVVSFLDNIKADGRVQRDLLLRALR